MAQVFLTSYISLSTFALVVKTMGKAMKKKKTRSKRLRMQKQRSELVHAIAKKLTEEVDIPTAMRKMATESEAKAAKRIAYVKLARSSKLRNMRRFMAKTAAPKSKAKARSLARALGASPKRVPKPSKASSSMQ